MRVHSMARVLLAFLVGSLCLVAPAPTAAAADGTTGEVRWSAKVNIEADFGFTPGGCSAQAWWIGTREAGAALATYQIRYRAECNSVTNTWNAFDGTLRVKGSTFSGAPCIKTGKITKTLEGKTGTKWRESAYVTAGDAPADNPNSGTSNVCIPDQFETDYPSGRGPQYKKNVALPALPPFGQLPPDSECVHGTPVQVLKGSYDYDVRFDADDPSRYQLPQQYIAVSMKNVPANFGEGWVARYTYRTSATTTGTFETAVGRVGTTSTLSTVGGSETMLGPHEGENPRGPDAKPWPSMFWQDMRPFGGNWLRIARIPVANEIVGMQIFNNKITGNATTIDRSLGPGVTQSGTYNPRIGTSDATRCAFWLGPKLWNDGQSGGPDEPWTDVTPPPTDQTPDPETEPAPVRGGDEEPTEDPDPPQEDSRCEFKITDPSTWTSGAMCSMVGLLKMIGSRLWTLIRTVAGLPGDIVAAIAGWFEDLFVPDTAALGDQTKRVKDAWNASSIGQYGTQFAGIAQAVKVPEASGCAGPTVTIPIARADDVDVQPLSACGQMAGFASVVKIGIGLMFLVGAALTALRVFGASIGLNLNGMGGGSD